MADTMDSLLVDLGFDYDDEDINKFKAGISSTLGVVKKFITGLTAAAGAVTALTAASTAASDEQGKFANDVGESVENIDAMQYAARIAGGSADGLSQSLRSLTKASSEANVGAGALPEVFGRLGLDFQDAQGNIKSTLTLFNEISDAFKNISKSEQIELSDKLGLGSSIRLLQQGSEGIKKLTDDARLLGVTTKEDAAISADFQDSLVEMWQITKQISRVLSKQFAPIIEKGNDLFKEWWKTNRAIIEQNFPLYLEKVGKMLKPIIFGLAFIASTALVLGIFKLISAFRLLSTWILVTKGVALALPVAIVALTAAIAGLAEDANAFFKGQDSLFGDLIAKFPEYEEAITNTAVAFKAVYDTFFDLIDLVGDGFTAMGETFDLISESVTLLKPIISDLWEAFKGNEAVQVVMKSISDGFQLMKDGVEAVIISFELLSKKSEEIFKKIKDSNPFASISDLNAESARSDRLDRQQRERQKIRHENTKKRVASLVKTAGNVVKEGSDIISPNTNTIVNQDTINKKESSSNNSVSNRSETNNAENGTNIGTLNISIDGAGDPKAVADELLSVIENARQKDLTRTSENFGNGVVQ